MNYYEQTARQHQMKWPYEVDYSKQTVVDCDILIIGGGLSGCFTAIAAAKRGAKVVVLEKGDVKRSGGAGAGIDHWEFVATNPCSKLTPDEMVQVDNPISACSLHTSYITLMEAYDAALELEEYGVPIRDTKDEFAGAPFRDEETKLMFAYDYNAKNVMRIYGKDLKPALAKEMERLGITVYNRTMATTLLTEGGKTGGTVVGATGYHMRTGEFFIFNAKATVMATAKPLRLWEFATELVGSNAAHGDPNCAGDGNIMAWDAGATLMLLEGSNPSSAGRRYPAYGTGNSHNTWYPCSLVDATGKEVPWVDRDGKVLTTIEARNQLAEGQEWFGLTSRDYEHKSPTPIPDLSQRIMSGEFKLPFYADLPAMPDHERRGIFGLMLGNEGKTYIPIVHNMTKAGFDPKEDMLQANVLPPQIAGMFIPWWDTRAPGFNGSGIRETSFMGYGGIIVGWDLKSSLEGLFAIGSQVAAGGGASHAAATGRYCGRVVAKYVADRDLIPYDEAQASAEHDRVYQPLHNTGRTFGWKEIQLGICRMMQDYCGEFKSKEVLETGLWWLNSIREHELSNAQASNPHDLARVLECGVRLKMGELIMHQSLLRQESADHLGFKRLDYSQPTANDHFITIRQENGTPIGGELPLDYWLKGDNAPDYISNYKKHCCLEEGEN